MLTQALEKVAQREDLSRSEMADAIGHIVSDDCPPLQVAGLLMALRAKGESYQELAGAAQALRARAVALPTAEQPRLDTVGTGGDGAGTINLSTAAGLIAAAAGISVAKHGNRSISSKCGSSDVLQALGVPIDLSPEDNAAFLAHHGFAFMFAPLYHPAMKAVGPIRQALGVRTLFNLLGPLTNPASVPTQLIGVYHPSRIELMARAAAASGIERALVVSAAPGLDEISPEGETQVAEVSGEDIAFYTVTPETFGLKPVPLDSIKGDDAKTNARIIRTVLSGGDHPARTGILLNAAGGLYAAGAAQDLRAGAALAAEIIDSGKAASMLDGITSVRKAA